MFQQVKVSWSWDSSNLLQPLLSFIYNPIFFSSSHWLLASSTFPLKFSRLFFTLSLFRSPRYHLFTQAAGSKTGWSSSSGRKSFICSLSGKARYRSALNFTHRLRLLPSSRIPFRSLRILSSLSKPKTPPERTYSSKIAWVRVSIFFAEDAVSTWNQLRHIDSIFSMKSLSCSLSASLY